MLFAFCRTIGQRNTALLRNVSEHGPWDGVHVAGGEEAAHASGCAWVRFNILTAKMGLHEQGRGAWKFNIM
jgi:hypothetical protein